ncbi:MAG: CBS domain-containing protein [Atopostipes suicloacalis]|nr:CBS domain-containing protein [Atopostipes suicloacalis]
MNKKTTVYDTMFDIMVDSNNYLPVVDEEQKYLGVITQEKINKMLRNIKDETMEVNYDRKNN